MCAYKTAWSRSASSIPSDRIPPPKQRAHVPAKDSSVKGKSKDADLPKSKEVRRLEGLKAGLVDIVSKERVGKDPKGGCYCQGMLDWLHIPITRR